MVRPKTTLALIRELFKRTGARYERPPLYSVAVLRRAILSPELPIILLACAGVYATVRPIQADMIWWYLGGLALVALWALGASVRARGRTEGYMARIENLYQESVRLHKKSISRLDILLTKKPGDQVALAKTATLKLPPKEQTHWERFKALVMWILWD
jgi:hypothetical protein